MLKYVLGAAALVATAAVAAAETVPIAQIKRGQSVTVQGEVDRFFDTDEIRLRDDSGTVRVYLGPRAVPIDSGERITVEGVMNDDLVNNELYARKITRANGDVIEITGEYD